MKVVVVSPHPVAPPTSGDRIRTFELMRSLIKSGIDAHLVAWRWDGTVDIAPFPTYYVRGKPDGIAKYAAWRAALAWRRRSDVFAIYRFRQARDALLRAVSSLAPEVVDFQHAYMWMECGLPTVCTFHNVETHALQRAGASARVIEASRTLELSVAMRATTSVALSELDTMRLREIAPSAKRVVSVPLAYRPDGPPKSSQADDLTTAVFVGSFDYQPNVEAVEILNRLWPRLRAKTALSRLIIVGRGADCLSLPRDIEVYSDIDDVPALLRQCDVLLVPLLNGGGVRVKIIEALALRIPIVATEMAVEGLGITPDVHAKVVASPEEFIDAVTAIAPRATREAQTERGYAYWSEHYDPQLMSKAMIDIYDETITRASV